MLLPLVASAQQLQTESIAGRDTVAREVLVKLQPGTTLQQLTQAFDAEFAQPVGNAGLIRIRSLGRLSVMVMQPAPTLLLPSQAKMAPFPAGAPSSAPRVDPFAAASGAAVAASKRVTLVIDDSAVKEDEIGRKSRGGVRIWPVIQIRVPATCPHVQMIGSGMARASYPQRGQDMGAGLVTPPESTGEITEGSAWHRRRNRSDTAREPPRRTRPSASRCQFLAT